MNVAWKPTVVGWIPTCVGQIPFSIVKLLFFVAQPPAKSLKEPKQSSSWSTQIHIRSSSLLYLIWADQFLLDSHKIPIQCLLYVHYIPI